MSLSLNKPAVSDQATQFPMGRLHDELARLDAFLGRIAEQAADLTADPDGHVRRSVEELRAAFVARRSIEPCVERLRCSMRMLRRGNHEGTRREFQRRATGLDRLDIVVEQDLLPALRRLGFEV